MQKLCDRVWRVIVLKNMMGTIHGKMNLCAVPELLTCKLPRSTAFTSTSCPILAWEVKPPAAPKHFDNHTRSVQF